MEDDWTIPRKHDETDQWTPARWVEGNLLTHLQDRSTQVLHHFDATLRRHAPSEAVQQTAWRWTMGRARSGPWPFRGG